MAWKSEKKHYILKVRHVARDKIEMMIHTPQGTRRERERERERETKETIT